MKKTASKAQNNREQTRKVDPSASEVKSFEQRLVRMRSELKSGRSDLLSAEEVEPLSSTNFALQAEAFFLRGSIHLRQAKFAEAAKDMVAAAKLYVETEALEKSYISQYNLLVARKQLGAMDLPSCLKELSELSEKSARAGFESGVALCARQMSYLYFEDKQFLKAFEMVEGALKIFSAQGLVADYYLSLIQAADCAIELGKREKARTLLDYIPEDAEKNPKLQFPLAYIRAKLSEEALKLSQFLMVSPAWSYRIPSKPIKILRRS